MTSVKHGESDLQALLLKLEPQLLPVDFVFCSIPHSDALDLAQLAPLAMFNEAEGLSVILPMDTARAAGLSASCAMRCITLSVHSSLEAVGLTAAIAATLAEADISANVVAAFHHDHVFVPADKAGQALSLLQSLSGA
ncbi:MAG: hypothetical protein ACI9NT_000448 [Bacteroidia bacterium]|jgi:hypothetical protein